MKWLIVLALLQVCLSEELKCNKCYDEKFKKKFGLVDVNCTDSTNVNIRLPNGADKVKECCKNKDEFVFFANSEKYNYQFYCGSGITGENETIN